MSDQAGQPGNSVPDEMSEYLQVFMDESDEQLEELTETLLVLENQPESADHLNEAFRLIHSIKGSAGMMGLDSIAMLTHHLESRFERFRSGVRKLDEPTMNLVLRCIDFLRECIRRLRAGRQLGGAGVLLQELADFCDGADDETQKPAASASGADVDEPVELPIAAPDNEDGYRIVIRFDADLPLVDLKARLILSRLSNIGDVVAHRPSTEELEVIENCAELEVFVATEQGPDAIRAAADVDGVSAIELASDGTLQSPETPIPAAQVLPEPEPEPQLAPPDPPVAVPEPSECAAIPSPQPASTTSSHPTAAPERPEPAARTKPTETMRVEIDRLDMLMNLAGELVVNRARFVQVASQVAPVFGQRNITSRTRDFSESLRRTIKHLQTASNGEWITDVEELKAGLDLLEEQSIVWAGGRRGFSQIREAIDQLTRISGGIQQSVLDTRMVPVAPLFTRFKRVVRDLALERGKKVELQIHGEKTELDKRMIDELGDPLVHLVRNSIDHGLESPDVRRAAGKPETGTIVLEASHRGNNVLIRVRDDGRGIDVATIRSKIVERGLLGAAAAEKLSDANALEYIWHAGFSTAQEVTDISGRGVGMDAVKMRITELNGQIDLDSTPEQGTTITIRLPLTLAIINSLLIRARDIVFSMPIDDVREIVAVQPADVVTVHGKQTIDVRGTFIPLVGIEDVFDWGSRGKDVAPQRADKDQAHAVILQSGQKMMGLRADALIGSQDIVIKSLSENFVHIRGLSGASILGDGSVCLMLDVAMLMDLAARGAEQENAT